MEFLFRSNISSWKCVYQLYKRFTANIFGGTWVAITGRFPYFNAGTATGGANTKGIKRENLPAHNHRITIGWGSNTGDWSTVQADTGGGNSWGTAETVWKYNTAIYNSSGNAVTYTNFNVMPVYQTLYTWRRTKQETIYMNSKYFRGGIFALLNTKGLM